MSAWQAHKDGKCQAACWYCRDAKERGRRFIRFIPAGKYAAYVKAEREKAKANR